MTKQRTQEEERVVHPAAHSFEEVARAYERGRPSYPTAAVDSIMACLPSSVGGDATVLDLAAGTGKLTRLLVRTGVRTLAIEPAAGMRAVLRQRVPEAALLAGVAESIPLKSESLDLVTVAQGFHWFQPRLAAAEIYRVLKPRGGLALLWNRRDLEDAVQAGIDLIVRPFRGGEPEHETVEWMAPFKVRSSFSSMKLQIFDHQQSVDRFALLDRVLSFSYIASLPQKGQRQIQCQLLDLVADLPAEIVLPYKTHVFTTSRA